MLDRIQELATAQRLNVEYYKRCGYHGKVKLIDYSPTAQAGYEYRVIADGRTNEVLAWLEERGEPTEHTEEGEGSQSGLPSQT